MEKNKKIKIVNFIYIITMAIGLAIVVYNPAGYQLGSQDDASAAANLNKNSKAAKEGVMDEASINLMSIDSSVHPSVTPNPTPIPTPTPLPVYPLEEKGYPAELSDLAETYYMAKSNCDIDALKSISSHPENVISKEQLLKLVEGIEEYKNIKCYVKKSYEEGAYIVFVYYDIKFIGLKTLAPSLSKLYFITDGDGKLKTYDGELTEELRGYITARSEDDDVVALREHTNQMAEEAKEKDKELKAFWDIIDKY